MPVDITLTTTRRRDDGSWQTTRQGTGDPVPQVVDEWSLSELEALAARQHAEDAAVRADRIRRADAIVEQFPLAFKRKQRKPKQHRWTADMGLGVYDAEGRPVKVAPRQRAYMRKHNVSPEVAQYTEEVNALLEAGVITVDDLALMAAPNPDGTWGPPGT